MSGVTFTVKDEDCLSVPSSFKKKKKVYNLKNKKLWAFGHIQLNLFSTLISHVKKLLAFSSSHKKKNHILLFVQSEFNTDNNKFRLVTFFFVLWVVFQQFYLSINICIWCMIYILKKYKIFNI